MKKSVISCHTPEMISDGQVETCCHCGSDPVLDSEKGKDHEVYDGCIGKLKGSVMNACCGHGDNTCAYVQFWDLTRISGEEALDYQSKNKTSQVEALEEDLSLLTLVGFIQEDLANGNTITSSELKERLRERREALKAAEEKHDA